MLIKVTQIDLVRMVAGVQPGYAHHNNLKAVGRYSGSYDRWDWDMSALKKLSEEELYDLYKIIS